MWAGWRIPLTRSPRQREPRAWVHHTMPPVALLALAGRGRHQLRPETPQHYDKGGQDVHIVPDVVVFQFFAPIHLFTPLHARSRHASLFPETMLRFSIWFQSRGAKLLMV